MANNHDIGSNTNELLQEGQRLGSAEYATRDSAFQGSYEIRDAKMWEPGERSAVEDFTKEDNPMFGRIVEYDDETKTEALMHEYMESQGYALDITKSRLHHEIYLSDPRKTPAEKWKTVIRYPIR